MVELTREVRINLAPSLADAPLVNAWSGWPTTESLAVPLTVRVTLKGPPDRQTGMLANVSTVDAAVRRELSQRMRVVAGHPSIVGALQEIGTELFALRWPPGTRVVRVAALARPFISYFVERGAPGVVTVTHQFEFSAAHRLVNPALSDEQNADLFGKCARRHGHGHNYLVDVSVRTTPADSGFDLAVLEKAVQARVIGVLDHTNLNEDIPHFRSVNPTVENIAAYVWCLLAGIGDEIPNLTLATVRVYETARTWADYSGDTA